MKIHRIIVLTLLAILAGCSVWQRVDRAHTEAPDHSYSVELPLGWMRFAPDSDGIDLTRDGFGLNRIEINRRALDKAFPYLKKGADPAMLPSELAEMQIAEAKSAERELLITVKDNAPALLDGKAAYRLHLMHKNDRGLAFDRVIYGLVTSKGYFTLSFTAPALHYSARDLPAFEKAVDSFKLTSRQ